ncbi:integrase [Streptomyces sp. NPDC047197]|uniref:integrase n=1 Tax=Streptomyces sp. NPDC047197 TaxID=3155477 RepID=UPI0033DE2CC0
MSAPPASEAEEPDGPADVLLPGMTVRWEAGRYLIGAVQGSTVHLVALDEHGLDAQVLVSVLVAAGDFAVLDADGTPREPEVLPDLSVLDRLDEHQRETVQSWKEHVQEVLTGRPVRVRDGRVTPRPGYDPATTTRSARYALKASELAAAGLTGSVATVQRKCLAYEKEGLLGLIDQRWLRTSSPHGRCDQRLVDLVLQERTPGGESAGTLSRLRRRVRIALRRAHPDEFDELWPARSTFYDLLQRLGISAASEERAVRRDGPDEEPADGPFHPPVVSLLGERVQIDSTGLDVIARGDDGRPAQVELTYGVDNLSRCLPAGMIVPKQSGRKKGKGSKRRGGRGTKALDASLLLAQMMAPLPARPGWAPLALAENSDLPFTEMLAQDPRMAGAAARPVIRPKTVVVDNAKIFKAGHFKDACETLGIEVEPARERTAVDKQIIERTNASIKSGFSQFVAGYTGNSLGRRGKNVEHEPLLSLNRLQDLWHEWVVTEWQNTEHEGLRSPIYPAMVLTPNQMYATAVATEGVPRPASPKENRKLLLRTQRIVTRDGIKIDNRTYVSSRIRDFRHRHTGIKGQGQRWPIYYNPYVPQRVWLYDHTVEGDPARDPWVPFDFKYQHLIHDDWTQYLWEQAALLVSEEEDREGTEEAIARAVDKMLDRARRGSGSGSSPAPAPAAAFVPQTLEITEAAVNPYAGITPAAPGSVRPAPLLNVAAKDLFPGQRAPGPTEDCADADGESAPQQEPAASPGRRRRSPAARPHGLDGAPGDIFRGMRAEQARPPSESRDSGDAPPGPNQQET